MTGRVEPGGTTRSDVAHLLRRAGFGGTPAQIDALAASGYDAAVDALCAPLVAGTTDPAADEVAPPTFDSATLLQRRTGNAEERAAAAEQARVERQALMLWWLRRMVAAEQPLAEKLTLWWHDHFATSIEKVDIAELMYRQRATLHDRAGGRFDDLVGAVARDPAMLVWLDGRESTAGAPNENFARELLELFTLGHHAPVDDHGDHDDHGSSAGGGQPYTEQDVGEAARALTGWVIDRETVSGVLVPQRFDAGTKTVLGTTGPLGLDDVVRITTEHPACAPHVVSRLWSRLARPAAPDDPTVRELAAGFAADLDVAALLRSMLRHPEFRADASRTGLVKMPIEYVAGVHRQLGSTPTAASLLVLDRLGQLPFRPPDVSGWPANEAWLSTASALIRLRLAEAVDPGATLDPVRAAPASQRPDELAHLLGLDGWGDATLAALARADEPRNQLTVALVSPEYVLN